MDTKSVLHEWRLDMEFNKANGQLSKEGDDILAALVKADQQDIYSLDVGELTLIEKMASMVLNSSSKSKEQIAASLREQGIPEVKIPGLVSQTIKVHKEAQIIQKTINRLVVNFN